MSARAVLVGTLVLIGAVVASLATEAQQPTKTKTARVGIFVPGSSRGGDQFQLLLKAFRDGLRDLGWIEGQTVVIETRWGEGRPDEFNKIASELIARPVDVLVTWGPQAIRAAQQASATVPIVMAIVHEPVAFGFVKSLARPGANITGSAFQDSELGTKRLELLKEIVPRMRRVDAVFQVASPLLATYRAKLIELAAAQRLPMTCETTLFVMEGCLMAYGPDFQAMSRQAAIHVDKILKGARPADLPIEQPTKFELAINARTANTLGLTISRSLRQRADKIVE